MGVVLAGPKTRKRQQQSQRQQRQSVAGGGGAALLFGAVLSVATELGSADTHYAAQHNRLKD